MLVLHVQTLSGPDGNHQKSSSGKITRKICEIRIYGHNILITSVTRGGVADPNSLKSEIVRTNRYNSLLELRKDIKGFYGKLPFSVFVDLRGRIEEKINTYNSPMCDQATINIIQHDGNSIQLPYSECQYAVSSKIKLSEYIFNKYQNAEDFQIVAKNVLGTYQSVSAESEEEKKEDTVSRSSSDPQIDVLQNRVEYLIRLMDHMARTYGEAIPKIVNDVKEITARLDDLYMKIMKDEVKQ